MPWVELNDDLTKYEKWYPGSEPDQVAADQAGRK
jgi:hypothetical protein